MLRRLSIVTVLTLWSTLGDTVGSEHFVRLKYSIGNPTVISLIGDKRNIKLQFPVKDLSVTAPVCVHKLTDGGNAESQATQKPLINLHLVAVALLPVCIDPHGSIFTC